MKKQKCDADDQRDALANEVNIYSNSKLFDATIGCNKDRCETNLKLRSLNRSTDSLV